MAQVKQQKTNLNSDSSDQEHQQLLGFKFLCCSSVQFLLLLFDSELLQQTFSCFTNSGIKIFSLFRTLQL